MADSLDEFLEKHKSPVFFAMPFHPSFDEVYQTMKGVVSRPEFDLAALRVDELISPSDITDDIFRGIEASKVFVADLSPTPGLGGHLCNPNVAAEYGYATRARVPMVLLTTDLNSLPFDIRQTRVLKYDPNNLEGFGERFERQLKHALNIDIRPIGDVIRVHGRDMLKQEVDSYVRIIKDLRPESLGERPSWLGKWIGKDVDLLVREQGVGISKDRITIDGVDRIVHLTSGNQSGSNKLHENTVDFPYLRHLIVDGQRHEESIQVPTFEGLEILQISGDVGTIQLDTQPKLKSLRIYAEHLGGIEGLENQPKLEYISLHVKDNRKLTIPIDSLPRTTMTVQFGDWCHTTHSWDTIRHIEQAYGIQFTLKPDSSNNYQAIKKYQDRQKITFHIRARQS